MSLGARSHDQDLGDILLAARLIDEAALAQARRECQRTSRPLWRIVTRDNLVTEDALFKALRQEVRVPVLAADQLKSVDVPEELRATLPPDVAQHLGILPLERSTQGQRAVLAMVDPTADITPIWPALTKLGVVEVRRFLVHLGTLRLGLETFYKQPWRDELDDAEADGVALRSVQASLARSATTQPIPVSAAPSQPDASVMVDPGLQAEMLQMDGPTDPHRRAMRDAGPAAEQVSRSAITPRRAPASSSQSLRPGSGGASSQSLRPVPASSGGSSQSLRPVSSGGSSQSLRPVPASSHPGLAPIAVPPHAVPPATPPGVVPYRVPREISVPELQASDIMMMVDEQPIGVDIKMHVPEGEPVQDAYLTACEALSQGFEAELRTGRPEALARLAQGVGERLGFAPRAVRELMLVARLFGFLRLLLLRNGPLPRPSKGYLGFDVKHPLMTALRDLQTVLVDFIRLPTEPDLAPMGARIVDAVVGALELADEGFSGDDVDAKLRLRGSDGSIVSALLQIMERDLQALGITVGRPEPLPSATVATSSTSQAKLAPPPLFVGTPLPPLMPDVRWRTTVVTTLSDEGFSPYAPAARAVHS